MTAAPSWFAQAPARDPAVAPTLVGATHSGACIVGGGFSGRWTARH
jgi:hypothetical protein